MTTVELIPDVRDLLGRVYGCYGLPAPEFADNAIAEALLEAGGTCKRGQTAKATRCVPASGDAAKPRDSAAVAADVGQAQKAVHAAYTAHQKKKTPETEAALDTASAKARGLSAELEDAKKAEKGKKPKADKPKAAQPSEKPSTPAKAKEPESRPAPAASPAQPAPTKADTSKPAAVRELKDNQEITGWAEKHFGGWNDSLQDHEFKAIEKYSGAGYESINNALRKGGAGQHAKTVAALDSAIARTSIPEDVTAFRGVRAGKLPDDLKPGAVLQDNAYVSTSLNRAVGEKFAHHTLMEIKVPKGSKGAAFDAVFEGGNRGENELMLPRGSKFKVTGVAMRNGKRVVTAELIHGS